MYPGDALALPPETLLRLVGFRAFGSRVVGLLGSGLLGFRLWA